MGIEHKGGRARKSPQQNFNDMYIDKVDPVTGIGQMAGEK